MRLIVLLAALCAVLFIPAAHACDVMRPCYGNGRPIYSEVSGQTDKLAQYGVAKLQVSRRTRQVRPRTLPFGLQKIMAEGAGMVVGGRPAGCPRAFCGCGASLHIFGKIVPALNLAANWLRFPRTEPKPGMVAVKRHHVFVLVRHIRGPIWMAHDSNSGRHRTRIHPRSIAGFVIVDPGAGA